MKRWLLWGGGGLVLLIIAVLVIGGDASFEVSYNGDKNDTPETVAEGDLPPQTPENVVSQVKWKTYTSDSFGYSIRHPLAWTVKELSSEGRDILISEPQGVAFVRIRGMHDPAVNSAEAIKASIETYRQSLIGAQDGSSVTNFESKVEGEIGGFMATGEFTINDVSYRFEERGLLATNDRVLIMRGAAIPEAFELINPIMKEVMDSFSLID